MMMVMPETQVSQGERCRVIAERVMGITPKQTPPPCFRCNGAGRVAGDVGGVCNECHGAGTFYHTPIPDYFTDPAAMVEVMDKLADGGFRPLVNHIQGSWHACVTDPNSPWDTRPTGSRSYESFQPAIHARGPTPMFAVAEAAYQWSVASVTPPADASSSSAP